MIETNETVIAYTDLKRKLWNAGYRYTETKKINEGKYEILIGRKPYENLNILLLYKKAWYNNFGKDNYGQTGIGDSVNSKDLKRAVALGCEYIARITPLNKVYLVDIFTAVATGIRRLNKEGKEVLSFSIHKYKNIENIQFSPQPFKNRFDMIIAHLESEKNKFFVEPKEIRS